MRMRVKDLIEELRQLDPEAPARFKRQIPEVAHCPHCATPVKDFSADFEFERVLQLGGYATIQLCTV